MRYVRSLLLKKLSDARCDFHAIIFRHFKLHQYNVVRPIFLPVELLDHLEGLFSIWCHLSFDLMLLEHRCNGNYIIEIFIHHKHQKLLVFKLSYIWWLVLIYASYWNLFLFLFMNLIVNHISLLLAKLFKPHWLSFWDITNQVVSTLDLFIRFLN